MKTYPARIITKAMMSIIDKEKYVKFSYYNDYEEYKNLKIFKGKLRCKPSYVKGKIVNVMCSPEGLLFFMNNVWLGKSRGNKKYLKNDYNPFKFEARNIRWEYFPFDWNKINEKCIELVKQLPESPSGRVLKPAPESTRN